MKEEGVGIVPILVAVVIVSLAVVGTFLLLNEEKSQPSLEYANLSLTAENRPIDSPLSFEFAEDNFFTGKIILSVDITNPRDSEVTENVKLLIDDSPSEGDNGELRDNKYVELETGQTKTITFVIFEDVEDNYIARIGGSSKKFQVVNPFTNPVLYPAHYYGVAMDYVPREYEVPEEKDINGLVEFLNQIEMPPYSSESFKCTHSSAMLEWLLEGAGFDADIAVDFPENKKEGKYHPQEWTIGHSWVMVYLENNREIAIESILLGSSAWVASGYWKYSYTYDPPGIIETPDNYLRKHSIELSDFATSRTAYYYENMDNICSSPKEMEEAKEIEEILSHFGKLDYNWWTRAINHPGIKSAIYDVEPFSEWE